MPIARYQGRFGMRCWIVRVCRTLAFPWAHRSCRTGCSSWRGPWLKSDPWSLAARFHGPPECYAGLLSRCPLAQRRAVDKLKADWKELLSLEYLRLRSRAADRLWQDIHFARNMPVRVMFVLFEAGRFEPSFLAGKHWSGPQCRQSTVFELLFARPLAHDPATAVRLVMVRLCCVPVSMPGCSQATCVGDALVPLRSHGVAMLVHA